MRTFLLIVSIFFVQTLAAQQNFRWVKGGGSTTLGSLDKETAFAMCTDKNGNIYSLNVVSDRSVPVYADTFYQSASTKGGDANLLVTSYTCDGTMRWAKMISSNDYCKAYGIAVDTLGHVYVAGHFISGASVGGIRLRIGYDTMFTTYLYQSSGVLQLDTNGNYKWIRLIGDNVIASSYVGYYRNPLVLDANANPHFLCYMKAGVKITPSHTSIRGVYDIAYDANGNMINDTRLDLDSQWYIKAAAIDPVTGKLYVCGQVNQDYYGGLANDTQFAAVFDASRHLIWRHDADGKGGFSDLTLSVQKNLYFTCGGNAIAMFKFNGDSTVVPSGWGSIGVVMRTDSNGKVKWMRRFDCPLSVNGFAGITLLPNEKSAVVGLYARLVTDDRNRFTINATGQDPYMAIVDSSGDVQTLETITGGGFYDRGTSITSDRNGNVYVGGGVVDSIWAGTPPIKGYKSVGGDADFFVMKYGMNCACSSTSVAAFTYSGTHTLSVSYTGSMTGVDSVIWDWGDGSALSKGLTSSHTYALADTYRVCATVYTNCTNDIYCQDVIMLCGAPISASFSDTGMTPKGFTYTGSTSTVDSVTWDYGDGTLRGKGNSVTHIYSAVGVYTVCATAWSICGNGTSCHTVTVTCVSAPISSFSNSGYAPLNVTYTGTTTAIDSVVWSFGDGGKAKGLTASHSYAATGIYTVCATAYNKCGSSKTCQTINIICITGPTSAFTDTGHIVLGATYTGTTALLDSVVWDFGDGSAKAKGLTALHTYTAAGIYKVCATAYNPCGNDTYCRYDTVICVGKPDADFTNGETNPTTKLMPFNYTGTTDGVDSIVWNFGDGATDRGPLVVHAFSVSGTRHVCVTVYTKCGKDSVCHDVITKGLSVSNVKASNIAVYPNPARDELVITGLVTGADYILLSITGAVISNGKFAAGENILSTRQLVPGVYILELVGTDGDRMIFRVVKE